MIRLEKRFRGKREALAVKGGNYSGYVDGDGNLILTIANYDGRQPDYIVTISGASLRPTMLKHLGAMHVVTGFDYSWSVKVK